MQDKGKILIFQIDGICLQNIRRICSSLNIDCIEVPVRDYDQKMLTLTGIGEAKKHGVNKTPLPGPMLVFAGINEQVMDTFLNEYKTLEEKNYSLKAILTMYNSFWTPKQLYTELSNEHRKFRNK